MENQNQYQSDLMEVASALPPELRIKLTGIVDRAIAKGKHNKAATGMPGGVYADRADRDAQIELAQNSIKFFMALRYKNYNEAERLYKNDSQFSVINKTDNFNEGTGAEGGYLVPQYWYDQVITNVEKYGWLRKLGRKFPMAGQKLNIPTASGALTASWVGELTAATQQDATNFFGQLVLTAAVAQACQIISLEELADTNVALIQYLSERTGIDIARLEDIQLFMGTGAGVGSGQPFTGIDHATGVNTNYFGGSAGSGKTAFSNISWTDIITMVEAVNPQAQGGNAGLFVSQPVFSALLKEKDSNGRPIQNFMTPPNFAETQGIGAPKTYMANGTPVYVIGTDPTGQTAPLPTTSAANTLAAVYGDISRFAAYGIRQDMTVRTFDESYNGFDLAGKRAIALVSYERIGIGITQGNAFSILKTSVS